MEQIDIPQERRYCSKLGFSVLAIMLWSILWQFGLYWLDGWILPVPHAGNAVLSAAARRTLCSIAADCVLYMAQNTADAVLQGAGRRKAHGPLVCHRLCADVARFAHRHEYQRHGLRSDRTRSGRHGGRELFTDADGGHRSRCLHHRSAVRGAGVPRSAGRPSCAVRAEAGRLHFRAAVRPVSRQSGAVFLRLCARSAAVLRVLPAPDCCAPRCCCTCCSTSSARWCPCCCRIP